MASSHDAGPPGVEVSDTFALMAVNRYRWLWPPLELGAAELQYAGVIGNAPDRCWPTDPKCLWVIEYGLDPGSAHGPRRVLGVCRVHAQSGVVACAPVGKPETVVGNVFDPPPKYEPLSDADTDASP